ncbi:MAG: M23 family metallopeptidase [Anaerolineaceae bacterium]|nr:M23 family metallopeptidase [Anaerolineaceae bacterium]
MSIFRLLSFLVFLLITTLSAVSPMAAQGDCGLVTTIGFPVDRGIFQLAQDFAAPSPRHQGRYHTGEDYFGGRGMSYGQPVRAIANGRVTYSAPRGWGRDGGVVIIQHTFPDGSVAYSQYGHMEETATRPFPARYSCVSAGDVIGSVGNIRPAPHLHFEMRTNQPDVPGPGYTWAQPETLGWLAPSAFITNWNAWLQPAYRFHLDSIGTPLVVRDGSLIYLAANRVRGATPDGRVLWRINLERPAVGLSWLPQAALLVYADGTLQEINLDGSLGQAWATGLQFDAPPVDLGPWMVAHTTDHALVAFTSDRRAVAWRLDNVAPLAASHATAQITGLLTRDNDLLLVSSAGALLEQRVLPNSASLGEDSAGNLLVYSQDGLWRVAPDATWTAVDGIPPAGSDSAVLEQGGRLVVFDGGQLAAYNPDMTLAWETPLYGVAGAVTLKAYGGILLLTVGGNVYAWGMTGGLCGAVELYQERGAALWPDLGADGLLRIAAGDTITGFDWRQFLGVCSP